MPNRILLIFITLLLGIGSASAQKYPERSLVRKGNRDFAKERYDRSIERYTQALEAAPENFEAAYNLGGALYRTEKYEEAAKMLERIAADSTRTDQERAEAFYNLGNAQFKQEKYPEALESYKNSLRMNPADQEAKYNYAYTKRLLQKQQNEAALLANDLLPPQITTAELIKEYTALAGRYNLRIESIKPVPQEKQKKEAYTSVTVNIVLTGSFYKAAAFLDDLQQQKRFAVPANVVIERSKNGFAGDVILTASLTAYALK